MGLKKLVGGLFRRFVPREESFFDYFTKQACYVEEASKLLAAILARPDEAASIYPQLKQIETAADDCLRMVYETLSRRFVVPLDREDIVLLARNLDNIVDNIDSVGKRMTILAGVLGGSFKQFELFLPCTKDQIGVLVDAARELPLAVKHLAKPERMPQVHAAIHMLENRGDELWEGNGGILNIYYQFLTDRHGQALTRGEGLLDPWVALSHAIEDTVDLIKNTVDHMATVVEKFV